MGQPDFDIHADGAASASSLPALAAYLRQSCGHVQMDERTLGQGFRFYSALNDEIPGFFNRRLTTGVAGLAITLQGGVAPDGSDPFSLCDSHADAVAVLAAADYEPTSWSAAATVGNLLFKVDEIASPSFIAKHPVEFLVLAEALVALGIGPSEGCPGCDLLS